MFDLCKLKQLFFILSIILVLVFPSQHCQGFFNSQLDRYTTAVKLNVSQNPLHLNSQKYSCVCDYFCELLAKFK